MQRYQPHICGPLHPLPNPGLNKPYDRCYPTRRFQPQLLPPQPSIPQMVSETRGWNPTWSLRVRSCCYPPRKLSRGGYHSVLHTLLLHQRKTQPTCSLWSPLWGLLMPLGILSNVSQRRRFVLTSGLEPFRRGFHTLIEDAQQRRLGCKVHPNRVSKG